MSDLVTHAADMRDLVLSAFEKAFPAEEFAVREVPINDIMISLPAASLVPAVRVLADELGILHLSTITADDTGDHISILYHFWHGSGVTLETQVPLTDASIATLTRQIPGASFYEREIFEMFGVVFEGNADLAPLLLPEDWEGPPPMLKSSAVETESQA
jgi:NADH:ubiquinone oxidoreductase subunit C